MGNLNPLFQEMHPAAPRQTRVKPKQPRQERSNKTQNVKYPVDHLLYMKLRTYCLQLAPVYQMKYKKPLSQTKFNTLLLKYVLEHIEIVNWNLKYKDTKRYMHTNLKKGDFKEIGGQYGLSIRKGFSIRKTVFLMIRAGVDWIERGGDLEAIL